MKSAVLFIPLAVQAGCSTISSKAPGRVAYARNYGPDLSIDYGSYVANIESPEVIVTRRQRSSSSEFWYESATHSLRVNGDNITYKDRQMAPRQCHAT